MKKKFLAFVCLTAMVFALCLPPASGAGYEGIYCVAVNDNFLLNMLTSENMPFPSGGYLYVPYTVFDGGVNGEFDLYSHHNKPNDTLTIFALQKALIFSISSGTCVDQTGTQQQQARAISRNGRLFVPVLFVCNFFGLTYSYLSTEIPGGTVPIIRISNELRYLSDAQFAPQASYAVADKVIAYQRSLTSPPATPSQSQPTVSPPPSPPVTSGGPPDRSDIQTYLAFEVTGDAAGLGDILATLATRQTSALFLFRPDELAQRGSDVRRVLGRGHLVGLLLDEDVQAGYDEGIRLLAHLARVRTRVVSLPAGAAAAEEWVVWSGNLDGQSPTGSSSVRANTILSAAATRRSPVRVTLGCDTQAAAVTGYLLRGLLDARYDLRPVTEVSLLPAAR